MNDAPPHPGFPHPDGILIPRVFTVPQSGAPFIVVPANNLRVYLSVANQSMVLVGLIGSVSIFDQIGMLLPIEGKVEWKWRDVGSLLQLDLFASDSGFGAPYLIEEVENWPKQTPRRKIEAARKERIRNAVTVQKLKQRVAFARTGEPERKADVFTNLS